MRPVAPGYISLESLRDSVTTSTERRLDTVYMLGKLVRSPIVGTMSKSDVCLLSWEVVHDSQPNGCLTSKGGQETVLKLRQNKILLLPFKTYCKSSAQLFTTQSLNPTQDAASLSKQGWAIERGLGAITSNACDRRMFKADCLSSFAPAWPRGYVRVTCQLLYSRLDYVTSHFKKRQL